MEGYNTFISRKKSFVNFFTADLSFPFLFWIKTQMTFSFFN
jgi:hypothetical protein